MEEFMKRISILLLVFCTCFALTAWPHAQPQAKHKIITFNVPGAGKGAGQGTLAWGIVKGGWIQGDYVDGKGVYHGFLRDPHGNITRFDVPGMGKKAGQGAVAVDGMAADREIVGAYYDANNSYHGFLRNPTTRKITKFECPWAGAGGTFAGAVNEKGLISAVYFDSNGALHGCLRKANGHFIKYDPPDSGKGAGQGTYLAEFSGINPKGAVVGDYVDSAGVIHAFLRAPGGTITEFNDPNAGPSGGGTLGIDGKGEIWGWYFDANTASHGYLRSADGKTFTEVDAPGAGTGYAQGTNACLYGVCFGSINPSGAVTGWYVDSNKVYHGFVRAPGGKITEFDVPGAGTGAWQGTQATAINPEGDITGHYTDAKGVYHGFLWMP
jgi:hypothetical protein